MKSRNPIAWVLALVLPIGFAGIWRLQHSIDAQRASLSEEPGVRAAAGGHLLDACGAVLRK